MIDLKQHDPTSVAPPPAEHITLMADQNGVPTLMQPDGTYLPLSTNGVMPSVASPAALPGSVDRPTLFFSTTTNDVFLMVGSAKFIVSIFPV